MAYLNSNEPYDRVGHPVAGAAAGLALAGAGNYLTSRSGVNMLRNATKEFSGGFSDGLSSVRNSLPKDAQLKTAKRFNTANKFNDAASTGVRKGLVGMRRAGRFAYGGGWRKAATYGAAALMGAAIGNADHVEW